MEAAVCVLLRRIARETPGLQEAFVHELCIKAFLDPPSLPFVFRWLQAARCVEKMGTRGQKHGSLLKNLLLEASQRLQAFTIEPIPRLRPPGKYTGVGARDIQQEKINFPELLQKFSRRDHFDAIVPRESACQLLVSF